MKFIKDLSRSVYRFSYPVKGSFNLGEICPIGAPIEVVPGDEIKADVGIVLRMATPIAPIMDDLDAELSVHFVPLRLVSTPSGDFTFTGYYAANGAINTFEKLIGNGVGNPADWTRTNNQAFTAPTATWTPSTAKSAGYTSIGEALGLGLGCGGTSVTVNVNAYPLFGYNLIYNTRFRNEDVEAEPVYLYQGSNVNGVSGNPTATSGTDNTYNHSLSVAYKHGDRYTNGKPSPTKGAAVTIPLGKKAPIYMDTDDGLALGAQSDKYIMGFSGGASTWNMSAGAINYIEQGDISDASQWNPNQLVEMYTNLETATASTINQFITSYNVQRLLMNDIKGTRYYEVIKNHFGIQNEDIKLYIPELLNVRTFAINISPVVQQSGSAAATSSTDQGNYLGTTGGYSFTANHGSLFHHAFGEYGLVYFLIVCRQRHTYGQGIPRVFLRSTRFDWFFPELGRIGYQMIKDKMLNADVTADSGFAYEPAWEELRRVNEAQAFGFLNPAKANSLDYWTLTDNFTATPQLEMAFLKENRVNLARALTIGSTGPDFIMDAMIYGKKSTLVPIGSEPKLFN